MSTWTLHREQSIHIDGHINHTILHESCQTNFLFDVRINTWWGRRRVKQKNMEGQKNWQQFSFDLIIAESNSECSRLCWEPIVCLNRCCGHKAILGESEANLAAAWPLSHVHQTHHPSSVSVHINVCFLHSPNEQGSRPTDPALPSDPATQVWINNSREITNLGTLGVWPATHILRGGRFYSNTCLLAD